MSYREGQPDHNRRVANACGFTLIELLVVIAVISLLMAISLPVLHRVRKQARALRCQTNLRQFGIIVEAYAAEHDGSLDLTVIGPEDLYLPFLEYADDANDLLLCPSASVPAMNVFTTMGWLGTTFKAWAGVVDVNNIRWQGSYTINRYAGDPQTFLLLDITPMKR